MINNDNSKYPLIKIIDFGMATKYIDNNGVHKPMHQMKEFKGNLIFASTSVVSFNRPSRKDDLISLSYFLLFLLNGG
jgi:serine/threonine protein kinase